MPKIRPDIKYFYADYLQWDDHQRWELIDGVQRSQVGRILDEWNVGVGVASL
jgi:hypothetical protein